MTLLCKLGMTKVELRRLAAGHAHFFSFTAGATRAKLLLLRTQARCQDSTLHSSQNKREAMRVSEACGFASQGTPMRESERDFSLKRSRHQMAYR